MIHWMPSEILGEIFGHCVDECHRQEICTFHVRSAVIVLANVCTRWRVVVLRTPRLWDRVSFHRRLSSVPVCVDELMQRSAARPLEVTIIFSEYIYSAYWQRVSHDSSVSILQQLLQSSVFQARVGRLEAALNLFWYRHVVIATPVFDVLHTLNLTLCGPNDEADIWSVCSRFRNAPSLRNVLLRSLGAVIIRQCLPPLPFAQLETLEFDIPVDALVVHSILKRSLSLRKAIFPRIVNDTRYSTIDITRLPAATSLPLLETFIGTGRLSLKFELGKYPLLQAFTLPSLKTFELSARSPSARADMSLSFLPSFQRRSGFSLTTLRIVGPLPAAPVLSFIQNNPEVQSLTVENQDGGIFALLTCIPDRPPLLPHLQELTVVVHTGDSDVSLLNHGGEDLAEMLRSRLTRPADPQSYGSAPLRAVTLQIPGEALDETAEVMIRRMREGGHILEPAKSTMPDWVEYYTNRDN
ncbi:hypothetical protein C8F01DRAFT_1083522 [Mycena amicta]|nr:hypothetical protein C8F01DRAFT_1083522 [Mycena amicta]